MRRSRPAVLFATACFAVLLASAPAHAAKVTSLKPWAKTNTYLAVADIDGRTGPKLELRAAVDYVREGDWVRIACQTTGQKAYGSTLWDKVGSYYIPDALLKTYTDGRLKGAPSCSSTKPSCQDYTVYGLRGSGESLHGNSGMGSTVGPTADRVRSELEGKTVALVGIQYPAVPVDVLISDPGVFLDSMRVGEIILRNQIVQRIEDCPRTRIAVIGYSQGAGVASETMRRLPASAFDQVRVAALYADTYSAGETSNSVSFDYFDQTDLKPVSRRGAGVFGGRPIPSALNTTFDICFLGDIVCDSTSSSGGELGLAFLASIHTHYKDFSTRFFPRLPGFIGAAVSNAIRK